MADKIDMREIADETGVAYEDVVAVFGEIIDGSQGTWLFSNHIKADQRHDLYPGQTSD